MHVLLFHAWTIRSYCIESYQNQLNKEKVFVLCNRNITKYYGDQEVVVCVDVNWIGRVQDRVQ